MRLNFKHISDISNFDRHMIQTMYLFIYFWYKHFSRDPFNISAKLVQVKETALNLNVFSYPFEFFFNNCYFSFCLRIDLFFFYSFRVWFLVWFGFQFQFGFLKIGKINKQRKK